MYYKTGDPLNPGKWKRSVNGTLSSIARPTEEGLEGIIKIQADPPRSTLSGGSSLRKPVFVKYLHNQEGFEYPGRDTEGEFNYLNWEKLSPTDRELVNAILAQFEGKFKERIEDKSGFVRSPDSIHRVRQCYTSRYVNHLFRDGKSPYYNFGSATFSIKVPEPG